jgi:hypothetical protein
MGNARYVRELSTSTNGRRKKRKDSPAIGTNTAGDKTWADEMAYFLIRHLFAADKALRKCTKIAAVSPVLPQDIGNVNYWRNYKSAIKALLLNLDRSYGVVGRAADDFGKEGEKWRLSH